MSKNHSRAWDGSASEARSRLHSIKFCQAYLAENMRPEDKVKALYYDRNIDEGDNRDKLVKLQLKYAREADG